MQQPKIYSVSDHDIDPSQIDADALFVLSQLHEAGFTAYLVGGSVRDLLLKRTPKDVDISTSALPEEIKQIFRRQCILIGKRFRLAHVRFGRKIIEVSTFRSAEKESDLILRDNVWGTPEEDAKRRDFTINGLFYDPNTHTIIDYVGGWDDIHNNVLKTIGEAEIRFKQDPVRMMRLLKFRARFGFEINPPAKKALIQCHDEILKSSPARLLEEILRMLESGASAPFFNLMFESNLLELIYPSLAEFMRSPVGRDTFLYLTAADKLIQSSPKNTLDRSILIAGLLYPMLKQEIDVQQTQRGRHLHLGEILMAVSATLKKFQVGSFLHFPRRLTAIAQSILTLQYRLTPLSGKIHHHPKTLRQKDFSLALSFLKVRAIVDKSLIDSYTAWKTSYRHFVRQGERRGHLPHHNPPFHADNRPDEDVPVLE